MKRFKYKGYDKNAAAQVGTLEAENYAEAYAALIYQGLAVVSLVPEKTSVIKLAEEFFLRRKLGGNWTAIFFRELSVMLGVMTLHDALKTLEDAARGHAAEKILHELVAAIEGGENFSAALSRHELIFDSDAIQSVEIGEKSGRLQEVTARLAEQLGRNYATGRKIRGAMFYPLTVFAAAIIAAVIMINVTLPVFDAFFTERGGELPLITRILFHGGKFLTAHLFAISVIILAAIIFTVVICREVEAIKFFLDRMKLQVKILREIEFRNLFSRISFLLESGLTLDAAVRLSSLSSGNLYIKKVLWEVQGAVERGGKFGAILRRTVKNFSPLYLGLIVTGEESGELVEMLRQCETMADFEIDEILRELPAKAEVLGTLAAGAIVAALVFATVLPILSITDLF